MYNCPIVCLNSGTDFQFYPVNEVLYLTSDGNYSKVKLKSGKEITTTKKLKELESLLPENYFSRVHNSYIVNIFEVVNFIGQETSEIEISTGEKLKVSRRRKADFMAKFIKI